MGRFSRFIPKIELIPEIKPETSITPILDKIPTRASTADPVLRDVYLSQLRKVPNLSAAATYTGLTSSAWANAAKRDPELAASVAEARGVAAGRAEEAAFERAIDGTDKGIFYQGEQVATEKEFSDTLLARILSAYHPRYVKRQQIEGHIHHQVSWVDIMKIADGDVSDSIEVDFESIGEEDLR